MSAAVRVAFACGGFVDDPEGDVSEASSFDIRPVDESDIDNVDVFVGAPPGSDDERTISEFFDIDS
ncbi:MULTISPECIES: hypothetical protein [Haloferax]|uniref:Uncharacterized protein n=1 Tax=Haloferax marinum TaxID=2666143 RepID=A0A6A8GAY3_9EURY|nr:MULTISPECIES: hypothetical protein [Haloferax]KAB1198147.1 hypothetical protein Hfx1150_11710 [Haloferax sp. CBA1150]MRW97226.1 hypothetical protein [Haloferax marinum]